MGRLPRGRSAWVVLALRGLSAWVVLVALGYVAGPALTERLLPAYEAVTELLLTDFAAGLSLGEIEGTRHIRLNATVTQPIVLTERVTVPVGREVPASITVLHSMVPAVILLTVVLAWPAASPVRFALRLALALLAVALTLSVINPIHLAGNLERGLQSAILQLGGERGTPWVLKGMVFMEGGGRWVLPLVAGVMCVLATEPRRARDRTPGAP